VRRPEEVGVSSGVATQAGGIHRLSRGCGEIEDLGLVTARLHMGFAWAVAAFAGDTLAAVLQRQLGMRIGVKFL